MKITIDLDSTLCNFTESWNIWLFVNGYADRIYSTEEITSYDWYTKNHGEESKKFFLKDPSKCYNFVKPYEGAKDFINHCKENYDDVEILTYSTTYKTCTAKMDFCLTHFDFEDVKFFEVMNDKYKQTEGRILIDDYPLHIINHLAFNKSYGIIFDYQEKFGWSKLRDYRNLLHTVNPDMRYIHIAHDYDDITNHLNYIKENK